jgi:hypothetical protein
LYPTIKTLGFSLYLFTAILPINSLPVTTSIIGQGVDANIIALNTFGSLQITDIADTCRPKPPICCGVPNSLAFFLLLQYGSCLIVPCE